MNSTRTILLTIIFMCLVSNTILKHHKTTSRAPSTTTTTTTIQTSISINDSDSSNDEDELLDLDRPPYCSNFPCDMKYCFHYKVKIDGKECLECGCE